MTNKLFLYDIVNNIWDTLLAVGDPLGVATATAFHKSVIAGNYFITYGKHKSKAKSSSIHF